jgi:hypothetical protein
MAIRASSEPQPEAWKVKRRIKIPALVHEADALSIKRTLGRLAGVYLVDANISKQRLIVGYDIIKTDCQTILALLEETGFPPLDSFWSRCRMGWYRFTDENGRANAKAPPSSCCNKPPR